MTYKEKILAEIERLKNAAEDYIAQGGVDCICARGNVEMADDIIKFINSLPEEHVSEDLKVAAQEYEQNRKDYDATSDNEIVRRAFKAGAQWQKTKDESTTEDLSEYINELSKQFPEVSFAKLSRIAVRVAKWQMAQITKDATDVTVHVDAGGYPYIPQMELYDYDKDVPLAKKGDKYKVVLIKEE